MKTAEKFSYRIENAVGKGEIAPFPAVFSKGFKACNIQGLFGKSYTIEDLNYNIEATGQNNITHTPFTIYYKCFEGNIPYLSEKTEH